MQNRARMVNRRSQAKEEQGSVMRSTGEAAFVQEVSPVLQPLRWRHSIAAACSICWQDGSPWRRRTVLVNRERTPQRHSALYRRHTADPRVTALAKEGDKRRRQQRKGDGEEEEEGNRHNRGREGRWWWEHAQLSAEKSNGRFMSSCVCVIVSGEARDGETDGHIEKLGIVDAAIPEIYLCIVSSTSMAFIRNCIVTL